MFLLLTNSCYSQITLDYATTQTDSFVKIPPKVKILVRIDLLKIENLYEIAIDSELFYQKKLYNLKIRKSNVQKDFDKFIFIRDKVVYFRTKMEIYSGILDVESE